MARDKHPLVEIRDSLEYGSQGSLLREDALLIVEELLDLRRRVKKLEDANKPREE